LLYYKKNLHVADAVKLDQFDVVIICNLALERSVNERRCFLLVQREVELIYTRLHAGIRVFI